MKKPIAWTMLATMALAIAAPALAGGGAKCSESAQACLNHWAKGKEKPWAGLQYDTAENGTTSIKAITAGSPAASAGFQVGDVLVAMNGAKLSDKEAMKKAKAELKIGSAVTYTVSRAGYEKQISVTLAQMPSEVYASMVGSHMLESHVSATMAEAAPAAEGVKAAKAEKK